MKTLKTGLLSMAIICCLLLSNTVSANNIIERQYKELKTELSKMVQNPELYQNGVDCHKDITVKFKIDETGEIVLIGVKSDCTYLKQFVNDRLHHQKIDLENFTANEVYRVKLKFELK